MSHEDSITVTPTVNEITVTEGDPAGTAAAAIAAHLVAYDHGNLPTDDEKAALDAANTPSAGNPFATMADIGGGGYDTLADPGNGGTITVGASSAEVVIDSPGSAVIETRTLTVPTFLGQRLTIRSSSPWIFGARVDIDCGEINQAGDNTIAINFPDVTAELVASEAGGSLHWRIIAGDALLAPEMGGGTTDHTALSNLPWSSSGHTGTASRIAGFSVAGAATYYAIGTDLQAYDAGLASLTLVDTAADVLPYTTAANTWGGTTLTAFARTLLDDADASTARTTLGLGTLATQAANNVAITGGSITGMSSPTGSSDVATKGYVDTLTAGLKWKPSVVAASTAAVTLATDVQNGSTLDGVTLATGDRILLKNQAAGAENGIYVVAASGAPSRATDADSGTELVSAAVFVEQGTTNADKAFVCTNNSITIGATSITFTGFASVVGALVAANNLSDLANAGTARTNLGLGNVENTALSTWAGSTNITTLGTIGTGTWQGTAIATAYIAAATATPGASKIPVADASGKLAAGWGGAASSLATLDSSSKVVQDPANAQTTPATSKIPIGGVGGTLDPAWLPAATTSTQGAAKIRTKTIPLCARVPNAPATWTNMPAATTEFYGVTTVRHQADLSNFTEARLLVQMFVVGSAGAKVGVQYSTDSGSTWTYLDGSADGDLGSIAPQCGIAAGTNPVASAWMTLTAAARADVWLRIVGDDGNGVADPQFGFVLLEVR